MHLKLREKILIPVLLTVALGMTAGFVYSYVASTRTIENGIRMALGRDVDNMGGLIDKWLGARKTDLLTWGEDKACVEALTETGYYGERARQGARGLFFNLTQGYPYYDILFLAKPDGRVIASSKPDWDPARIVWVDDRVYFRNAIYGIPSISNMVISRGTRIKIFVVAVPVKKEGRIVGVIAGGVSISSFHDYFIRDFRLSHKGFAYVTERGGRVISGGPQGSAFSTIDRYDFGPTILGADRGGNLVYRFKDQAFIAAYKPLGETDWILVMNHSLDEAFAQARKTGWYSAAAGLMILVIVVIVVTGIFKRMIHQRFVRMGSAIRQFESGNFSVRLSGGDESDEIGDLSRSFNHMAGRLGQTLESLQHEIQIRRETETELARHRDSLEARVAERTLELEGLRNYLSEMINSMPSIIVGVTRDMKIGQWNRRAEEATGCMEKDVLGSVFGSYFNHLASLVPDMERAIGENEIFYKAKVPRGKGDKKGFDDVTVYPLMRNGVGGAVIRIDDVTDRVKLDEMMIQSEKMMSVGGLAAGMAHEINNPLAGMVQNVQLIRNRLRPGLAKNMASAEAAGVEMEKIQAYMEDRGIFRLFDNIVAAGGRAADIVDNMLSFSRKGTPDRSQVGLSALMDRTIELAENDYSIKIGFDFKSIRIFRQYPEQDLIILGQSAMLQQVFFNILKNGAQAMASQDKKGDLSFRIRIYNAGKNAVVEIEDNGPGMDKETRKRIFEPFFSTKGVGKGTGLGLSVSYFIISENHGGTIDVRSEPGKGTCFIIRLPQAGPN